MKLRLFVAAVAFAGFLSLSPRASAEFLSLEYTGNLGGTTNVTLNGKSYSNVNAGAFFWNDTNDPPNSNFPPPIVTFCIEVDQQLPATNPPTATFAVLNPGLAPTISAGALTDAKVDAIKALYGKNYDFANSRLLANTSADNRAFQLALWEIVYDFGNPAGLDLSDGSFVSNASEATNLAAKSLLDNLGDGLTTFNNSGYQLDALVAPAGPGGKTQDPVQDHLIVHPKPVPAPPAVLLAGIGVLALLGRARLTRRNAAAV